MRGSFSLKRVDFENKKIAYSSSRYKLANKVAEFKNWDLDSVNEQQKWLASLAVQTWRVD